jgi:hypothetical protein
MSNNTTISERCGNCRFWRVKLKMKPAWGNCWRLPPKAMEPHSSDRRPTCSEEEWCGEWQPKMGDADVPPRSRSGQPINL